MKRILEINCKKMFIVLFLAAVLAYAPFSPLAEDSSNYVGNVLSLAEEYSDENDEHGELIYVPNPGIPLGFIDVNDNASNSCPPPWWLWPLMAGLLLPWIPFLLWRRKITIAFESGVDDKPYLQKYSRGQKIVPPDAFQREGYEIEGWYRSKKFEKRKKWDFRDKVNTSMTLFAKWEVGSSSEYDDNIYS